MNENNYLETITDVDCKWIPVTDRSPAHCPQIGAIFTWVQVLLKEGYVSIGYCNKAQWWYYLDPRSARVIGHEPERTPVIAWQPLSQPPKPQLDVLMKLAKSSK